MAYRRRGQAGKRRNYRGKKRRSFAKQKARPSGPLRSIGFRM